MDVSWMLRLEPMDRRAMLRDLDAAIERARVEHRPEYIDSCLGRWQRVCGTLSADRTAAQAHAGGSSRGDLSR